MYLNIDNHPPKMKTKLFIINALLRLMRQKKLDQISITDIASEADVSRRTFYRHFEKKEDVLIEYVRIVVIGFVSNMNSRKQVNPYDISLAYFNFWYKHRVFLMMMIRDNLFMLVLDIFEEVNAMDGTISLLNDRISSHGLLDNEIDYFISFWFSGIWRLLYRWVKSGCKETPEEMASTLMKIVDGLAL